MYDNIEYTYIVNMLLGRVKSVLYNRAGRSSVTMTVELLFVSVTDDLHSVT
jgi:hypothetical protein